MVREVGGEGGGGKGEGGWGDSGAETMKAYVNIL